VTRVHSTVIRLISALEQGGEYFRVVCPSNVFVERLIAGSQKELSFREISVKRLRNTNTLIVHRPSGKQAVRFVLPQDLALENVPADAIEIWCSGAWELLGG